MDNTTSKFITYFRREIGVAALILITLISVALGWTLFSNMKTAFGAQIILTVEQPSSAENGALTFRGAIIEDQWFNPESLVGQGDWTLDADSHLIFFTEDTPVKLSVPVTEKVTLVFNAGPEQGTVNIQTPTESITYDLYRDQEYELGDGLEISGLDSDLLLIEVLTVVVSIFIWIGCILVFVWCKKRIDHIRNYLVAGYLILLFPAVVFLLMHVSISTTPLAKKFYGYDMQVFITQGMFWAKGLVPYAQAFDHKGPLTFFVYMVGWMLNHDYGIFALQCVSLYISLLLAFKIGEKLAGPLKGGIVSTLAALAYFVIVIDEGGLCEEFNLPFLMLSTYVAICYLLQYEKCNLSCLEHSPKYAFIYGATVAASICFRATNCVAICGVVLSILIYLLVKKEFRNLLFNAIGFICGFCLIFLPFLIYFMVHDAVSDFFWGTLIYNFMYASSVPLHTQEEWYIIILCLSPVLASAFLSLWRKPLFRNTIVVSAALTSVMLIRCYLFPHYYIIAVPFASVAFGLLLQDHTVDDCRAKWCRARVISNCSITAVILLALICSYMNASAKANWVRSLENDVSGEEYSQLVKEQASLIPQEEKDSVIAYNTDAKWYIESGIIPCFKYYFYQEWQYSKSEAMQRENEEFYESLTAKWIVIGRYGVNNQKIQDVLDTYYELYNTIYIEQDDYNIYLYRLKTE